MSEWSEDILRAWSPTIPPNQQLITAYGEVAVKRLDLLHPVISGNKWYKLKYNLEKAIAEGHNTLLTFGGTWSNHIHATAQAGKLFQLQTIGIIRGEEPQQWSSTLRDAHSWGMKLHFIPRHHYAEKDTDDFREWLHSLYGNFHLVPEGGSNFLGINGCLEILTEHDTAYDVICCACGTGATLAGLLLSAKPHQRVVGFSVLKNGSFLRDEVMKHLRYFLPDSNLLDEYAAQFDIITNYDFGGYAKWNDELVDFIKRFETDYHIPLDQVYTGKLFYGVMDQLKQHAYSDKQVLIIHSGGLQGKQSIHQ